MKNKQPSLGELLKQQMNASDIPENKPIHQNKTVRPKRLGLALKQQLNALEQTSCKTKHNGGTLTLKGKTNNIKKAYREELTKLQELHR